MHLPLQRRSQPGTFREHHEVDVRKRLRHAAGELW